MSNKNKPTSTGRGQKWESYNKDYLRDAIAWSMIAFLNLIQIIVFVVYFASQHG